MSKLVQIKLFYSVVFAAVLVMIFLTVEASNPPIPEYGVDNNLYSQPFSLFVVNGINMDDPNIIPVTMNIIPIILTYIGSLLFSYAAFGLYDKTKMRFIK